MGEKEAENSKSGGLSSTQVRKEEKEEPEHGRGKDMYGATGQRSYTTKQGGRREARRERVALTYSSRDPRPRSSKLDQYRVYMQTITTGMHASLARRLMAGAEEVC